MMAASADCSSSNTRAGPVITGFFRPVIFATQPSGERLPRRIARWPSSYIGSPIGRITPWSARRVARAGHLFLVHVGLGGGIGQAQAQRLEGRAHRVRGVHAAARAGAGDGIALDAAEVFLAHLAGAVLAHRLEHADDVELLA